MTILCDVAQKAVVQRLAFAVAELELASEIAKWEGDPFLLDQLPTLTERVRDCIRAVSNGDNRPQSPNCQRTIPFFKK